MKLKTLKDIEFKEDDYIKSKELITYSEDLREEAIKWIKDFDESVETAIRFRKDNMAKQYLGNIQEFKKFFNITEGDITKKGLNN